MFSFRATPQKSDEPQPAIKSALRQNVQAISEAPSAVERNGSPLENNMKFAPRQPDRPTTSRGKRKPSPEEYASYIIPSPQKDEDDDDIKVLSFNKDDDAPFEVMKKFNFLDDDSEPNESPNNDQVVALGCWLFGGALFV